MPAPYPVAEDNPFKLVSKALWQMAEDNPNLREWIPRKNRVKYDTPYGRRDEIAASNVPELQLQSETTLSNLNASSTSTMLTRQYVWILVTGDKRREDVFDQIQWELFRAMNNWCTVLGGLTWNNKPFVMRANFLASSEGDAFSDMNRNIIGWAVSWPFEVEMHFTTSDLTISDPQKISE